jgi:hypothetical protein
MRRAVLLVLTACLESHTVIKPLPDLVVGPPAEPAQPGALVIIPGERLIWEVASEGIQIGRAEMLTHDAEISSRFGTEGVATAFADVHEEWTTPIDRAARIYPINTALAWLRAWSPEDGLPAMLHVELDGRQYRVDCAPPIPDELHDSHVSRIACEVAGEDIAFTMWRTLGGDRTPVRFVARAGTTHFVAELVSRVAP